MIARVLRVFFIAISCAAVLSSDASFAAPSSFVRVLSDEDVATYKSLFKAAEAGDTAQISALIPQVKNKLLVPHVAAKNYLSPKTVSSFDQLKTWLKTYDDYPEASRLYALAVC